MQVSVCQIGGRQYLVKPGQVFEVDKISTDAKTITCDQVLLEVSGEKVEIGKPTLKKTLTFEVLGNVRKAKVRVAKFHAKANYRKVIGDRREMTRLMLVEEKVVKK